MSSKLVSYCMIGVLVLLGAAGALSIVKADQMLKAKGNRLMELKLENAGVEERQAALILAKKDIETYNELEAIAKAVVPQDKDQAKTVREINSIASESGIKLSDINFTSSSLGQPTKKSPTGAESNPAITQVMPVDGIKGVYSLEIVITADGKGGNVNYPKLIDFLSRLEKKRRTAHVSNVSIDPGEDGNLSFTLTLSAYLKP